MRGAESACVDVWAVFSRWALAAVGTSEFGLYGVVGGMSVIVMLVGAWWKCCGDASGTPEMV